MSARKLAEGTVDLMLQCIKTNIAAALDAVQADAPDHTVTTEPPRSYFIYSGAKGFRCPAVWVMAEEFDFRQQEKGANFIDALARINVSVLLEDRNTELLTRRCWRYQSALHTVLDETQLTTTDNKLKIVVVIRRATFLPTYSNTVDKNSPEAVFRKEVLLECDVDHYENF